MLFNSFEFFILFLPFVLVIYFVFGPCYQGATTFFLGCMSLLFLGVWKAEFALILAISILLNYLAANLISRQQSPARRRQILTLFVLMNLTAIFFYKYLDFTIHSINYLSGENIETVGLILPLGISFYTFTQTTFLVDTYRNEVRDLNFNRYFLFVTYFPHLIAGPILHHGKIIPQFAKPETYQAQSLNIAIGLVYFTIGLAKKVILADTFAAYANPVFTATDAGSDISGITAWCGALAYTLQIYFDFSGYSDMAVGLAKMMNVDIPHNFNSPYKASSIIDFWRRWHISLSTFLRDYVYIPLGGSKSGSRYVNLLTTMLIGGLWHGASWTFVFWGGLHGIFLIVNHWSGNLKVVPAHWPFARVIGMAVTFLAVVLAWVFFRSETFSGAIEILSSMLSFTGSGEGSAEAASTLRQFFGDDEAASRISVWLIVGLAICWLAPNSQAIARRTVLFQANSIFIIGILIIFNLLLLMINASRGVSEFIYFNF